MVSGDPPLAPHLYLAGLGFRVFQGWLGFQRGNQGQDEPEEQQQKTNNKQQTTKTTNQRNPT